MLLFNCRITGNKKSAFEDIVDAYLAYLQVSFKIILKSPLFSLIETKILEAEYTASRIDLMRIQINV